MIPILLFIVSKESSRSVSRVLCLPCWGRCLSFIYSGRHRPAPAFYPLTSDEQPSRVSLHELAVSKMHSQECHHPAGGLLPHLLTLTPGSLSFDWLRNQCSKVPNFCSAVVFFCITQPSRTPSILGSGMLCTARTFLSDVQLVSAFAFALTLPSDRPSDCCFRFQCAKLIVFFVIFAPKSVVIC